MVGSTTTLYVPAHFGRKVGLVGNACTRNRVIISISIKNKMFIYFYADKHFINKDKCI